MLRAVGSTDATVGGGKSRKSGRGAGNSKGPNGGGGTPAEDAVTWNPADKSTGIDLSSVNRVATRNAVIFNSGVRSTHSRSAGKVYFEIKINNTTNAAYAGIGNSSMILDNHTPGVAVTAIALWAHLGWIRRNNITVQTLAVFSNNDIMMCAVNFTTGKVWFGRNGTFTGDPVADTGEASAALPTGALFIVGAGSNAPDAVEIRAKTSEFTYSPPTGFQAFAIP